MIETLTGCEAVVPPSDGRLGFDPRPCGEPSNGGLRPMHSARGGLALNADGVTEPKFACPKHMEADRPYAYEPHLY